MSKKPFNSRSSADFRFNKVRASSGLFHKSGFNDCCESSAICACNLSMSKKPPKCIKVFRDFIQCFVHQHHTLILSVKKLKSTINEVLRFGFIYDKIFCKRGDFYETLIQYDWCSLCLCFD